jgi:hypothetical protein
MVMLGVDPDHRRTAELFVFAVTGEAKVIVVIGFDQLGSAGSTMGIVTIKAENPGIEMAALLKVEPLLVMGFGMGLRISPDSRLELVIAGERISHFIRFVILVIPWVLERSVWDAHPSRVALAAHLQASFILEFSGMNDFPLGLGRFGVFGARAMAFFTSDIELHISGFVSPVNLLQLKPCIVAARAAHFEGFLHSGLFETAVLIVPILQVIGNPPGGRLVPLERENVMLIPNPDLIALLPAPPPISPDHIVGGLFRRVFRID